jgi:hypothetical protein
MMPDPPVARSVCGSAGGDEDAEGVPVGVGVDEELLGRVVGAVEEEVGAETEGALVLRPERLLVGDGELSGQVEVGSSATCWKATRGDPDGWVRTSQSRPSGSSSPAGGASSPAR